mgnify:CR=1 FL=1
MKQDKRERQNRPERRDRPDKPDRPESVPVLTPVGWAHHQDA